ncbi:glycoside hydrolase family 15 protein [Spirillospora sp. CA-128828]|uniref:glycoside hydrolase family 15 protein n=1 Tax=Spirillospora sp. CA-128828 TaxID=3240033 RepID=UPI003D8AAAF2
MGELALLDRRGNVTSWCLPDANGVPVTHELYDAEWRTAFRLGLDDKEFPVSRRMQDTSHTLVSTWSTRTGLARERAWMVGSPRSSVHGQMARLLQCERGTVNARLDLLLRYGHKGEQPVRWTVLRSREGRLEAMAKVGSMKLFLVTNMALTPESGDDLTSVTGHLALKDGEIAYVWLGWMDDPSPATVEDVERLLKESEEGWFEWVQELEIPDNEYASLVRACAILLRGLGHRAGSFYAAASRSLPEDDPREVSVPKRTWDYLYHWLRDGGLTVSTLDSLGDREVLPAIVRWYNNLPDLRHKAKIMYGPYGEDVALRGEHIVTGLGHRGSIFRHGNGAGDQEQHDRWVYPLEHLWRLAKRGTFDLGLTQALADQAAEALFQPCSGVWEVRRQAGEDLVVYASAQVLVAQALYFAARIFKMAGKDEEANRYAKLGAKVKPWLLNECVRDGVIMAAPNLLVLDSSILLAMLMAQDVFNFDDPADKELARATVYAIDAPDDERDPLRGLRVGDGHVRYHADQFDDGISPDKEARFTNVTGWVGRTFLRLHEVERADEVMGELVAGRNDVGMFTEERTVYGRGIANADQAYPLQEVITFHLERADLIAAQARSEYVAV